ncbi:MAG: hypothetical protein ACK5UT_17130, partial [Acidobacteriota bacterium]
MLRRSFLSLALAPRPLRLATFAADVTPPLGAPLCYGLVPPAASVADPLAARGVLLLPAGQPPIVLCTLDWLGIGNASRDLWRSTLAQAARTPPDRVATHTDAHPHPPSHAATAEGAARPGAPPD